MGESIGDSLTRFDSAVRFVPTSNIRFIAEELRRYGIKTNKESNGKTVFYQSCHIVAKPRHDVDEEGTSNLDYALVSFLDLFQAIGKNDKGVEDMDIVRTWVIASKLEKRKMVEIVGTCDTLLASEEEPELPDLYAGLHHIHRNADDREDYKYSSKFATNKTYSMPEGGKLIGISDFFLVV